MERDNKERDATMSNTKYSFHDKRVTLQLARLSTEADQNPEFAAALNELPSLGFDVYKLSQEHQEILFAEFDDEMEQRIKDQFEADASYLIDLKHSMGVCPLCGHIGCRYIFRITNKLNGKTIECGSECIITHGLCVKGAETAEHARKALEATIRRHIKKLKIEAWHEDMGFTSSLFDTLANGLESIAYEQSFPYKIRNSARCKVRYDLPKLVKFYERNGWLNTEKRWAEWTRLVSFARKFDAHTKKVMSHPLPYGFKNGEPVELKDAVAEEIAAQDADLEQQAADEAAYLAKQEEEAKAAQLASETLPLAPFKILACENTFGEKKPVQEELPFNQIASELVFG